MNITLPIRMITACLLAVASMLGMIGVAAGQELVNSRTFETANGTEISWNRDWKSSNVLAGVEVDHGNGPFDSVSLRPSDSKLCKAYCGVTIVIWDAENVDPESLRDQYIATKLNAKANSVQLEDETKDSAFSLISNGTKPTSTVWLDFNVEGEADEVYSLTLSGPFDAFPDLLSSAIEEIEIDGEPAYADLDLDDVLDALEVEED